MDPLSLLFDVLSWIVPTKWSAVFLVLVVILPFVVSKLVFAVVDWVSAREFFRVPLIYGLTVLLGFCLGLALIHVRDETGRDSGLADIFRNGGPWDLPAAGFLSERANPLRYDLLGVIDEFLMPASGDALHATIVVGLACAAAILLLAFTLWPPAGAVRGLVAALLVALWATMLTIYLLSLTYWSMAMLNFWTFAVVLLVLQYYRNHRRHA